MDSIVGTTGEARMVGKDPALGEVQVTHDGSATVLPTSGDASVRSDRGKRKRLAWTQQ